MRTCMDEFMKINDPLKIEGVVAKGKYDGPMTDGYKLMMNIKMYLTGKHPPLQLVTVPWDEFGHNLINALEGLLEVGKIITDENLKKANKEAPNKRKKDCLGIQFCCGSESN